MAAMPGPEVGFLTMVSALSVGIAAWRLGAGRARKEDAVDHAVGIRLLAKPGDYVEQGQPLVELHADHRSRFAYAIEALRDAVTVGSEPPAVTSAGMRRGGGADNDARPETRNRSEPDGGARAAA